jgi:hypothetical protein
LTNDEAAMVDAKIVITCKLLEGRVEFGNDGRAPSGAGGEVTEQSIGEGVGRISGSPGGGRWKGVGSGI